MPKQETSWNIGWQVIFGILLIGIIFLAFLGPREEKTEVPFPEVMNIGNGIKLVYYPPQWPGDSDKSCFESTTKDGVFVQNCVDGKADFNEVLAMVQNIENTVKPTTLPQEKSEAQQEMENFLAILNLHKARAENCVTFKDSAVTAKEDENAEAHWWSEYENGGCLTLTEDMCNDIIPTLKKRTEAPFWWPGPDSPYAGKYVSTASYVTMFKAYKDVGCSIVDINVPKDQLTCLEEATKIEELKEYPDKYNVQPDPTIYNQLVWNYIDTCLTEKKTFK
jgi:hypothetical protein